MNNYNGLLTKEMQAKLDRREQLEKELHELNISIKKDIKDYEIDKYDGKDYHTYIKEVSKTEVIEGINISMKDYHITCSFQDDKAQVQLHTSIHKGSYNDMTVFYTDSERERDYHTTSNKYRAILDKMMKIASAKKIHDWSSEFRLKFDIAFN